MESETRNPFLSEVLSAESSFFKNVPEIGQFSPPPASFSTSTCGTSVSTNTTYIRNPTYPSRYKPSSASTCSFTINKVSDDICQLRWTPPVPSALTALLWRARLGRIHQQSVGPTLDITVGISLTWKWSKADKMQRKPVRK